MLPNSRLDSSLLKTRNLLGVFVGNNIFLRGLGPTSVLYMFSVEGGVGSDEDAKCTQNGSAPRKGHIPSKMRIFSESKRQKKTQSPSAPSITDQASHASRQPRTNSTPTPAPTDDRQVAVRYRYRDGLEVPHIVSLREPLDLALIRNAAALGATQQGDADTGLVLACHNISSRERARESIFVSGTVRVHRRRRRRALFSVEPLPWGRDDPQQRLA